MVNTLTNEDASKLKKGDTVNVISFEECQILDNPFVLDIVYRKNLKYEGQYTIDSINAKEMCIGKRGGSDVVITDYKLNLTDGIKDVPYRVFKKSE
jgi:hypothetical protein